MGFLKQVTESPSPVCGTLTTTNLFLKALATEAEAIETGASRLWFDGGFVMSGLYVRMMKSMSLLWLRDGREVLYLLPLEQHI